MQKNNKIYLVMFFSLILFLAGCGVKPDVLTHPDEDQKTEKKFPSDYPS